MISVEGFETIMRAIKRELDGKGKRKNQPD